MYYHLFAKSSVGIPLITFLSSNTKFLEGNMTNFRNIILGSASAALLMTRFGGVAPAMAAISHNQTDVLGHSIFEFNGNVEPGTMVMSASQRRLY